MSGSLRYYAVLGVSPASDDVVIRAAFKALMLKYHPDTNKAADATRRAAEINEAFSILSDPQRRAAYDQQLKAAGDARRWEAQAKASSPPPSPPPPPKSPPRPAAGTSPPKMNPSASKPSAWSSWVGVITVAVVGTLVRVIAQGHPTPTPPIVTADNSTVTPMTLMSDNMSAVDGSVASSGMMANDAAPAPPPAPTTLDFKDIEAGADDFARVLTSRGIAGARLYSTKCHAGVKSSPSWSAADRCAAFDYSAAAIDAAFNRQIGGPPDAYFVFQSQNQADQYQVLNAQPYALTARLQSIRQTAEPEASAAIEAHIAEQQDRRKTEETATPAPAFTATPKASILGNDTERD